MRKYGKIEVGFWQNPKMRGLSDEARLLYIYLIACPHGNSVGCFVLPDGYLQADLRWDQKHVSKHVSELVSKGLIERDQDTSLTWIKGWFGHNNLDNANVAKNAAEVIASLPRCALLSRFFNHLRSLGNPYIRGIETPSEGLPNPLPTGIELLETETETETETEKEKEEAPQRVRGTRLPPDWHPGPSLIAWAQAERPDVDVSKEVETFRDYWHARAGPGGVKLDWTKTFRNWIRNSHGNSRKANGHDLDTAARRRAITAGVIAAGTSRGWLDSGTAGAPADAGRGEGGGSDTRPPGGPLRRPP